MKDVTVANQFKGITCFRGNELAHSDSRRAGHSPARWVEMTLWKTEAGAYVLDRVGKSLVYHVFDGKCDRGTQASADRIGLVYRPCVECSPPQLREVPGATLFDVEQDRHEVSELMTPEAVIAALTATRNRGAVGTPFLSQPAQRLLELAGEADDGIRIALASSVIRIA
jgi:hypothetical protein